MTMIPTEDLIYQPENVSLFETIYGKNLISLGGIAAIDNMFSDLQIKGLKALDLGFGLGGVAFYLAKSYGMEVTGIEVHPWMVKHAEAHTPRDLAHLLKFATYKQTGEMPFQLASFDMVYSKGVLNHVQDKENLFQQVNAVLKPNGLFVIADWIYPARPSPEIHSYLVRETKNSYQSILEKTGFNHISFRDDSAIFLGYVNKLLENLTKNQDHIEKEYGAEIFAIIWDDHKNLIEEINHKRKFAVRITARK